MLLAGLNNTLLRQRSLAQIGYLSVVHNNASNPPNPVVNQGDFLLRFAARTSSNVEITVPGGWTVPEEGTVSSAAYYGVVAYQFAGAGGSSVAGTWTNAQTIITFAFTGVNVSDPISAVSGNITTPSGGPVVFGALDLYDERDWVVAFCRTGADISASDLPPAGLISRVSATRRLAADSNGPWGTDYAGSNEALTGHAGAVTYTVGLRGA